MKKSTLLTLAVAALLLFTIGCRNPAPKVTALPEPSATAGLSRNEQNFDTKPIGAVDGAEGVKAIALTDSVLADDAKLIGRDQDRTTFAHQTLYFEYDRHTVRSDEASKIAQVAAEFKTKGHEYDLLIEGHCDERGTEEYNRSLGERRALAIREMLIQSGVDKGHVFTKSLGKDQPANPSHDETAWGKNRRGEFVLVLPRKITTTQITQ